MKRSAPAPPAKSAGGSSASIREPPGFGGAPQQGQHPTPPPGVSQPSSLDRSASHRLPSNHPPRQKGLDRANTTRASGSKTSPPNAMPMTKSQSQQGQPARGRTDPGQPLPGAAQHLQGKQQSATPRRREKGKENEQVIRQLVAICSPGDPHQVYRGLQKIGQG